VINCDPKALASNMPLLRAPRHEGTNPEARDRLPVAGADSVVEIFSSLAFVLTEARGRPITEAYCKVVYLVADTRLAY
jgi:hypothetical protein